MVVGCLLALYSLKYSRDVGLYDLLRKGFASERVSGDAIGGSFI